MGDRIYKHLFMHILCIYITYLYAQYLLTLNNRTSGKTVLAVYLHDIKRVKQQRAPAYRDMPASIIICNPCWPGEASNKFKTRKQLKLAA